MKKLKLVLIIIGIVLAVLLIGFTIWLNCTATGIATLNNWKHGLQSSDDKTNYETLKKVEDTCRAMISDYNSKKIAYEQYKDSDDPDEQSLAKQYKVGANQIASSYNNYILKNKYVWKDNVPSDIYHELEYIE